MFQKQTNKIFNYRMMKRTHQIRNNKISYKFSNVQCYLRSKKNHIKNFWNGIKAL